MNFHLPSAKNLSQSAAVELFVPTALFWQILGADTHDLILGTRGSGKTMLLRMLSVTHLPAFARKNERARAEFEGGRLGIYLPVGLDWYGAYGDSGTDEFGSQQHIDAMNLIASESLLEAVDAFFQARLDEDERARTEVNVALQLSALWFREAPERAMSFSALKALLREEQAALQDACLSSAWGDERPAQISFRSAALLHPVDSALSAVGDAIALPAGARWMLCLDEVENLPRPLLRSLLRVVRGTTKNLVLKMSSQPYIFEDGAPMDDGAYPVDFRDFEIKRLQFNARDPEYAELAEGILAHQLRKDPYAPSNDVGIWAFGSSTFADRARETDPEQFAAIETRLNESSPTGGVFRQKLPVAAIRLLHRQAQGNTNSVAYSGWPAIIVLSDGNPGFLVKALNRLLAVQKPPVSANHQHRELRALAKAWVEWSEGIYPDGARLRKIIEDIGSELEESLHRRIVDESDVEQEKGNFHLDLSSLSRSLSEAFKMGARHALLVARPLSGGEQYPSGPGSWRLSYALTPAFWLLPRRGRMVRWAGLEGQKDSAQLFLPFAEDALIEHVADEEFDDVL